jgi:hypothetical protein
LVPQQVITSFLSFCHPMVLLLGQLCSTRFKVKALGIGVYGHLGAAFVERILDWWSHSSGMTATGRYMAFLWDIEPAFAWAWWFSAARKSVYEVVVFIFPCIDGVSLRV